MLAKLRNPHALSFALALFFTAVLNIPFWQLLYRVVEPRTAFERLFIAAVFAAVLLLTFLIILVLTARPIFKPLLCILLPLTAAASYFMLEYGVVIDANMVRNVFETNSAEARDLISSKMIVYIALLGVLPALLVWRAPVDWPPLRDDAWRKLKIAAVVLPLAMGIVFPFTSNVTSVFREHRELRMTLTPMNYLGALNKYLRSKSLVKQEVAPFAEDAVRTSAASGGGKGKTLFVVAIGETARADHFGLNGYAKPTTPELAKIGDLINFPDATSCGTDTAQSVPCIFSGLGRENFSNAKASARENLLDVLKRTGIKVLWRENQAGCKGVCERIATDVLTGAPHATYNTNGETHDEVLLEGLEELLKKLDKDTVIVLHMMGSHGPAYWKRYPEKFEVFKPVCRESQFSRCALEDIVNAYDNTILYSDFVLAKLIGILRKGAEEAGVATGIVYMSDHGESLGEGNIYLHGMPYAFAPKAQKHVPAVLWLSQNLSTAAGVDSGCLGANAKKPVSHDNIFHSILGIMDVSTKAYDKTLDVFAPCRAGSTAHR